MATSREIIMNIAGFIVAIYGGLIQDLIPVVIGMLLIFLNISLVLGEQEEDVRILKAQINTQHELKRLRDDINEIKNLINKKR